MELDVAGIRAAVILVVLRTRGKTNGHHLGCCGPCLLARILLCVLLNGRDPPTQTRQEYLDHDLHNPTRHQHQQPLLLLILKLPCIHFMHLILSKILFAFVNSPKTIVFLLSLILLGFLWRTFGRAFNSWDVIAKETYTQLLLLLHIYLPLLPPTRVSQPSPFLFGMHIWVTLALLFFNFLGIIISHVIALVIHHFFVLTCLANIKQSFIASNSITFLASNTTFTFKNIPGFVYILPLQHLVIFWKIITSPLHGKTMENMTYLRTPYGNISPQYSSL